MSRVYLRLVFYAALHVSDLHWTKHHIILIMMERFFFFFSESLCLFSSPSYFVKVTLIITRKNPKKCIFRFKIHNLIFYNTRVQNIIEPIEPIYAAFTARCVRIYMKIILIKLSAR